jgi:uncharacterized membrane protein YdjX (TVP38/TMEM64 family)
MNKGGQRNVGQRKLVARLLVVVIVAVIVASLAFGDWLSLDTLKHSRDELLAMVHARPAVSAIIFFWLCVTATALCFPAAPLIGLTGGALFGLWPGLALVTGASAIGSTLAFFESRYLMRDWVQRRLSRRLAQIDRDVGQQGGAYLLTLRLNPFIPYWLVNLAMGLTAMQLRTYVPLTVIGLIPSIFLYVEAGTRLATLEQPSDIASPALLAALFVVSLLPVLIKLLERRTQSVGE